MTRISSSQNIVKVHCNLSISREQIKGISHNNNNIH